MAKRKKDKERLTPSQDTSPLGHSPFAGLQCSTAVSSPPGNADRISKPQSPPSSPPQEKCKYDFSKKIVVKREKKGRKGKTVTLVSGLALKDLSVLAKTLKKKMGCGATIEDRTLVLQGDLVERIISWLEKNGAKEIVRGS